MVAAPTMLMSSVVSSVLTMALLFHNIPTGTVSQWFSNWGPGSNRGHWVGCEGSLANGGMEYFNLYHIFLKVRATREETVCHFE